LSGVTIDPQPLGRNRWAATAGPQPLRRLITPIGFGISFSNPKVTVFGQAFFEKACDHAVAMF
jgi:threonine/homoserine/homoserine lactone efflux protein